MNVCFITSTINIQSVTDKEYKKWWTYIGMRQMQQSAMFSCDDNQLKMMGVSPSKLSEEKHGQLCKTNNAYIKLSS